MPAHPATILIVDDDPALLRLLGILLREEGFVVQASESGEKALALAATNKPDLVLTDLRMSGIDGLELFDALQKMYPLLPVIIITAHGTASKAAESIMRGVFCFIQKPYEAKILLAEIRRALDHASSTGSH